MFLPSKYGTWSYYSSNFLPSLTNFTLSMLLFLSISVSCAKDIEINKYNENIVEYILFKVFSQKKNPKFNIQIKVDTLHYTSIVKEDGSNFKKKYKVLNVFPDDRHICSVVIKQKIS